MIFAPITPYQRAQCAYTRYKGVDPGVYSGRTIIEARERDIEKITKELVDTELYDTARTGLRGRTVHGHSVRLDKNGMMFDALRRWARDERTGEVSYVKDMIGGAMDKEVQLGKPLTEDELRKRTTMYRNAQGGVWEEEDDPESMDVCAEIHWKRTVGGFQPWKKISQIKGGKKQIGLKEKLKLYVPRGGVDKLSFDLYVRRDAEALSRLERRHQDSVSSADSRIKMAIEAGVNTEKAENLLRKARDAYPMNEWNDAIYFAEEAKNEVTKQIEELKSRVTSVKKYPDIDFPSRIKVRQRYPLIVRLIAKKLEEVLELTFDYPEGIEEIEITVTVDARDFEIEKAEQKMRVPLRKNSEPIVFYLTPNSVGNKTIRLKFCQNGNYNGEILVDTTVIDLEEDDEPYRRAEYRGEVGVPVKNGYTKIHEDLQIKVEKEDNYLKYELYSEKLKLGYVKCYCPEQLKDPKSFMDKIGKELSDISAASYKDKEKLERVMNRIEAIGMDLYKRLLPEELKRILWENRDEIKSIFIISDEEWIPWEIIKPFKPTKSGTMKEDFWCVKYVIGRWISGKYPEKSIRVDFGSVIACDKGGKLKRVNDEKESIEKIIENRGVKLISKKPRYIDILDLLTDKEINLFHFACDAFYDENSSDDSYLCLEDGNLKAREVGVRNLRKGNPMVFVNACESSITGYAVTGMGGFSKAFLDIGALAFVGTMWQVPDGYALKFSEIFYKNLFEKNVSIGEALKKTRADLKDLPNPIWLAYSLYGHPLAKVTT